MGSGTPGIDITTVACFMGGLTCAAVAEGAFTVYDLNSLEKDLNAGKISEKQYNDACGKRIVSGVGGATGCTTGAVVGQVPIPVPFVGAFAGGLAGALVGRFCGNKLWDTAKSKCARLWQLNEL